MIKKEERTKRQLKETQYQKERKNKKTEFNSIQFQIFIIPKHIIRIKGILIEKEL